MTPQRKAFLKRRTETRQKMIAENGVSPNAAALYARMKQNATANQIHKIA